MSNPELLRITRVHSFRDTKATAPPYEKFEPRFIVYEFDKINNTDESSTSYKPTLLNMDTLNAAEKLVREGRNPLVLCHADDALPGGFVTSGAGAQEEEIWRRTNISKALSDPNKYYPFKWNCMLIIPQVTVFKDANYKPLKEPFKIDILNVVALRSPRIMDNEYESSTHKQMMDDKIQAIFEVALKNKNDSLVLGALGCGAFSNPPQVVARLFRKHAGTFHKMFKSIIFAVLGTNHSIFEMSFAK